MPPGDSPSLARTAERLGRRSAAGLDALGYGTTLVGQSLYWIVMGRRYGQVVRPAPVAAEHDRVCKQHCGERHAAAHGECGGAGVHRVGDADARSGVLDQHVLEAASGANKWNATRSSGGDHLLGCRGHAIGRARTDHHRVRQIIEVPVDIQ